MSILLARSQQRKLTVYSFTILTRFLDISNNLFLSFTRSSSTEGAFSRSLNLFLLVSVVRLEMETAERYQYVPILAASVAKCFFWLLTTFFRASSASYRYDK